MSLLDRSSIIKLSKGSRMPEKKPNASVTKPAVAERPTSDVFEGRQPSAQEKDWAEKTLAPTLERAPEKPIGAATTCKSLMLEVSAMSAANA